MPSLLLVPLRDVLVFELVSILSYVLAARESITCLDMVECEETVVLLTHVIHPKMYRSTVSSRGKH
jgi:hypothetical protein